MFSPIVLQVDNFCDFLFANLHVESFLKKGKNMKQRNEKREMHTCISSYLHSLVIVVIWKIGSVLDLPLVNFHYSFIPPSFFVTVFPVFPEKWVWCFHFRTLFPAHYFHEMLTPYSLEKKKFVLKYGFLLSQKTLLSNDWPNFHFCISKLQVTIGNKKYFFSPWKHTLWVFIRSTSVRCF